MAKWNFLFSANAWLSFVLSERYYGGKHFVWCTPHFEVNSQPSFVGATPPTSTPKEIYQSLAIEVDRNDRHSAKIKETKAGLLKGARFRLGRAEISQREFETVREVVHSASVQDFRPLLYVINFDAVKMDLIEVPVDQRAHPLSLEFRIEALQRINFEVLDLPRMKV